MKKKMETTEDAPPEEPLKAAGVRIKFIGQRFFLTISF